MQKIGDLLKAEREKKGMSLHEVGVGLKINPKILKAIEEGDTENLPAKTFLRGFIRSYAQYLKMDIDAVLALFQQEMGSTRPEEPKKVTPTEEEPQAEKPVIETPIAAKTNKPAGNSKPSERVKISHNEGLLSNKTVTIMGILLLVFVIAFVAKMVEKYEKEARRAKVTAPAPIAEDPAKDLLLEPPVDKDSVATLPPPVELLQAPGSAPKTDLLTSLNQVKPPPPVTPTSTPNSVSLATPTPAPTPVLHTPTPAPTATPTPNPTPSPVASPSPKASPSPSPSPSPSAAQKPTEVIVEALNKVDVRYSFGDDKWETITLMADELHTFKSKTGLTLEVNDGGAISLIVNGRDKGVPGSIGKPIKLSYPK